MDTRHSPVALAFSASVTLLPPWYCVCHVSKSVLLSTPSPLPLKSLGVRATLHPGASYSVHSQLCAGQGGHHLHGGDRDMKNCLKPVSSRGSPSGSPDMQQSVTRTLGPNLRATEDQGKPLSEL